MYCIVVGRIGYREGRRGRLIRYVSYWVNVLSMEGSNMNCMSSYRINYSCIVLNILFFNN